MIFLEGTVYVISIVPMIVSNYFPFVLGLKSLFSTLITNLRKLDCFWQVTGYFGKLKTTRCCSTAIDINNSFNADTSQTLI